MSWPLRVTLLLAALLAACLLVVGCSGLPKDALDERLAALPANAPLARQGLSFSLLHVPHGADGDAERVRMAWVDTGAPRRSDGAGSAGAGAASGAGPRPVVLVHGTPASLYDWTAVVHGGRDAEGAFAGLAPERRVLAPDLPGHGVTRADAEPVDFAFCAAALAAFLELRVGEPAHLVGHSYGGEVALRVALDRPELVASLVLVDSAGLSRRDDEWLPEERKMRELPGASLGWLLNSREKVRGALAPHFAERVDDHLVEEMFLLLENPTNWGAMIDLARDENGHREGDLPGLTVPTLLLWGADDVAYTVERFAERFERLIPDAALVTLPGIGHYPQHEAPRAFLAELRAWLAARD